MPDDRERCLAAGMDDFIAKPVTPELLEAVLGRWSRPPQAEADAGRDQRAGPQPSPASGPVDWDVLQEVAAVTQPEFMRELVQEFLEHARSAMADLQGARARNDLAALRTVAHRLRGSCATMGARGMAQITGRLEALDQERLAAQGGALLEQLAAEAQRVEEALRGGAPPA
jgi:HPt (histidine-containing phosphotransfer) domain-containing protein